MIYLSEEAILLLKYTINVHYFAQHCTEQTVRDASQIKPVKNVQLIVKRKH